MLPTCLLSGPLSLHPIRSGLFRLSPSLTIIFVHESASPKYPRAPDVARVLMNGIHAYRAKALYRNIDRRFELLR